MNINYTIILILNIAFMIEVAGYYPDLPYSYPYGANYAPLQSTDSFPKPSGQDKIPDSYDEYIQLRQFPAHSSGQVLPHHQGQPRPRHQDQEIHADCIFRVYKAFMTYVVTNNSKRPYANFYLLPAEVPKFQSAVTQLQNFFRANGYYTQNKGALKAKAYVEEIKKYGAAIETILYNERWTPPKELNEIKEIILATPLDIPV